MRERQYNLSREQPAPSGPYPTWRALHPFLLKTTSPVPVVPRASGSPADGGAAPLPQDKHLLWEVRLVEWRTLPPAENSASLA